MKKYFESNHISIIFAYFFSMILSILAATIILNSVSSTKFGIPVNEINEILKTSAANLDSLKEADINKFNLYVFHQSWTNVIQYLAMFILVVFFARRFLIEDFKEKILNRKNKKINLISFGLVFFLLGVMFGYNKFNNVLINLVGNGNETSLNQSSLVVLITNGYAIPMFFSLVIFAPVVEELVFRKAIFSFFKKNTNKWVPILTSTALFALPHMLGAQSSFLVWLLLFIEYFLNGFIIAWLYDFSKKNIYFTILLHMLNNLIALIYILVVII